MNGIQGGERRYHSRGGDPGTMEGGDNRVQRRYTILPVLSLIFKQHPRLDSRKGIERLLGIIGDTILPFLPFSRRAVAFFCEKSLYTWSTWSTWSAWSAWFAWTVSTTFPQIELLDCNASKQDGPSIIKRGVIFLSSILFIFYLRISECRKRSGRILACLVIVSP